MDLIKGLPWELFCQLLFAAFAGGLIGLERELAHKPAGIRTYSLVSLGSALFSIISKFGFEEFWLKPGFDPSRIASQIVVGVGFIGAGAIILQGSKVHGITTAAGLWMAAAIGMAIGFKMYATAIMSTLLVLLIFIFLWYLEQRTIKILSEKVSEEFKEFKKIE